MREYITYFDKGYYIKVIDYGNIIHIIIADPGKKMTLVYNKNIQKWVVEKQFDNLKDLLLFNGIDEQLNEIVKSIEIAVKNWDQKYDTSKNIKKRKDVESEYFYNENDPNIYRKKNKPSYDRNSSDDYFDIPFNIGKK
jgi:hypothetical protein